MFIISIVYDTRIALHREIIYLLYCSYKSSEYMLYLQMYYYTFTHGRARTAHGRARTLACACHGRTDMPRTCHGHFLWPSVRVRACVHVRARTSHAPHALPRTGQCACHCLTTQPKPSYSQNLFCWLLIVVLSTCVDYHIILVERRCPAIRYRSRDIVWQEWRFTYHNYYHCVSIHPVHQAFLSSGEPWYSQKQFIPLVHSW